MQGKKKMKRRESKTERGGCKEHSNQTLTGVCSYCLRDKLLKLYDDPRNKSSMDSVPDSAEAFSSQSSSHYVSPDYHGNMKDSVSSVVGLKKCRSITFGSTGRVRGRDGNVSGDWECKKDGIWSKLFKFSRKATKCGFNDEFQDHKG